MCLICDFNQAKAEGFANNLLQMYNHGALTLMISIGHRTGLFDSMEKLRGATSEEIAGASGLNERYVREWLHAMTVGRIVETDEAGKRFTLPAEHATFLTRSGSGGNMAVFAQYIPVLAQVEEKIVDCFKNGGGVPYTEYKRFHTVMAEDSGQTVLDALFDHILPLAPGLIEKLQSGIEVLDVGCGSGRALNRMAEAFPNSRFTGFDLCAEPIEIASREAMEKGLTNVVFEQVDLTRALPARTFDLITAFDAIHDQARPDVALRFIHDSLATDGVFLMQDIDGSENLRENLEHPLGPLLYTISTMHCMSVSLAYGGMGLGTMWGTEKAQRMLKEAGFRQIAENRLEHDFQNCYFLIRK